jgi:hypothetical protein
MTHALHKAYVEIFTTIIAHTSHSLFYPVTEGKGNIRTGLRLFRPCIRPHFVRSITFESTQAIFLNFKYCKSALGEVRSPSTTTPHCLLLESFPFVKLTWKTLSESLLTKYLRAFFSNLTHWHSTLVDSAVNLPTFWVILLDKIYLWKSVRSNNFKRTMLY